MVGQEEVGGFTQRVKRAWSCLGDKEGVGVYFKEAYQGVTTVVQTALMPTFDYNIKPRSCLVWSFSAGLYTTRSSKGCDTFERDCESVPVHKTKRAPHQEHFYVRDQK